MLSDGKWWQMLRNEGYGGMIVMMDRDGASTGKDWCGGGVGVMGVMLEGHAAGSLWGSPRSGSISVKISFSDPTHPS